MGLIPYILFVTASLYQGNISTIATSACEETATQLQFVNGQTFPRLAGFNVTYNISRPFVGPTGLEIAANESMLRNSTLVRSLWDAKVGCVSSTAKLWSGLNTDLSFSVNVSESESPGPHCDGYYSNTTLSPPFLPWTSNHAIDGASVSDCSSTVAGWEGYSREGKTCDNFLQILCVFDPSPASLAVASFERTSIIGSRAQTTALCDSACLASEKSVALLYYHGEMDRFPQDLLYKNGMTGVTEIVVSDRALSNRVPLFSSYDELTGSGLTTVSSRFFTGSEGYNCNNFTSRTPCDYVTLNLNTSQTTACVDASANVLCFCYNEDWVTSAPTNSPTKSPTKNPTKSPTRSPTRSPTKSPTGSPSTAPTSSTPTKGPSTSLPTKSPTLTPTP